MSQAKSPKHNQYQAFPLLFIVPLLVVVDVIVYFMTRSSCLQCGGVGEFMKTSSMTFQIISQIVPQLRKA